MTYPKTNFSYNAAATRMGNGDFDWVGIDKRIVLFGAGLDEPDPTDATVADIGLTPIAVSAPLTGLTITADGFFKSNNAIFPMLTGDEVVFAVMVDDATDIMDAELLFHISNMNDLPFTPNGADWYLMPDVRGWFRP
jgi:hypothetical protein